MEFETKIDNICNNVTDYLLKNKVNYSQPDFKPAIEIFNNSIIPLIKLSNNTGLLSESVNLLLNKITEKCPFLSERGSQDTPIVKKEYSKEIVHNLMDLEQQLPHIEVKDSIIMAVVNHDNPNGFNSRKINRLKNSPEYFQQERLVFAAKNGNIKDLESLLNQNTDVHCRNERSLCLAAFYGHTEAVKLLVKNSADITHNNYEPLRNSIENNHLGTAQYLFNLNKETSLSVVKNFTYASDEIIGNLQNDNYKPVSTINNKI